MLHDGSIDELSGGFAQNSVTNINWTCSAVRDLTLKSPISVNELYAVYLLNSDVPTTIITDSPFADVELGRDVHGNINGVLGIKGNVYVTDLAGSAELAVWQFSDPTPRTVTLHRITVPGDSSPYGAIDGLAPATIAYRYSDMRDAGVELAGGQSAPATVRVQETATGASISGAAAVQVGEEGSVQGITGPLAIDGGSIHVDDSADSMPRKPTIANSGDRDLGVAIEGLSSGDIQIKSGSLVIDGGSGANAYTFKGPPSLPLGVGVILNTGGGNDTVEISGGQFSMPLIVNGHGGNDAFTVDYSDAITSDLILNGGSGSDTLTVRGPAPDMPFTLTSGTITGPPPLGSGTPFTISYAAFKSLVLTTGTFAVSGVPDGVNLSTPGPTKVKFQASAHLGAFCMGGSAQVQVTPGLMPLKNTLFCTGLSIDVGGKLDLANNSMQLSYSGADPTATIRSYLSSGFDKGAWDGSGIVTSAADATHGLGFGDSADGIVAGLPNNTLLVRWTRLGDVSLDGKVGFADLVALARNYGKAGQNWDQGDINYDGAVGFDDLLAVARNYGASAALQPVSSAMLLPEATLPTRKRRR